MTRVRFGTVVALGAAVLALVTAAAVALPGREPLAPEPLLCLDDPSVAAVPADPARRPSPCPSP